MDNIKESTYDDELRIAYLSSGTHILNFHKSTDCRGEHCPVHRPSDHSKRHLPLDFDYGIFSFIRRDKSEPMGFTIDPDDYNLNTIGEVVVRNSAICNKCEDEIESNYRHDFVTCSCGNLSVDGGNDYVRILAKDMDSFTFTGLVQKLEQ